MEPKSARVKLNKVGIALIFVLIFAFPMVTFAQLKLNFKDSLDQKFDLSDWVITAKGFIPIPYLITEPALGGFGGALMPVFIKPNTPYIDTVEGKIIKTRSKPNLYMAGAAYTLNGTWALIAGASGTIKKWRANYRLGGGYASVNMVFYKEIETIGEQSFEFNIQAIPIFGQLIKQIGLSPWFAGGNYLFLKTNLMRTNAQFHTPDEIESYISKLGLLVEYDNRDNVFTPNAGFRWNTQLSASSQYIGSDYDYLDLSTAAYDYVPITKKIIAGFRAEYQQVWGDVPFYLLPFVNMRGIPLARYQGSIISLAETEWRWDFSPRLSLLTFGGISMNYNNTTVYEGTDWHGAGGIGGRYLIARKLKLRMGVDVARGPEQWAYYLVFGTNWVR